MCNSLNKFVLCFLSALLMAVALIPSSSDFYDQDLVTDELTEKVEHSAEELETITRLEKDEFIEFNSYSEDFSTLSVANEHILFNHEYAEIVSPPPEWKSVS